MSNISPVPETKVTFFKSSGHKHDGVTSSIIDTSKYSIFDFGTDVTTGSQDRSRELTRTNNQNRFNQYIANFISTQILAPAGIELLENSVRGIHIGANEITANEIAANTITANNISAGTITATQIAANTITSNEIQTGTITASDLASTITFNAQLVQSSQFAANSLTGWALLANGDCIFNSGTFRGSLAVTGTLSAGTTVIYANGAIVTDNFNVTSAGVLSATGANISGQLNAGNTTIYSNGAIVTGNFNVTSAGVLSATGANISGQLNAGNTAIYSNGAIVTSNFNVTSLGVLSATGANISGPLNVSDGTFSGSITANGTITGGTISGATIVGGSLTSNTNTSGDRVVISGNQLNLYNESFNGISKIIFNNSSASWLGRIEGNGTGVTIVANGQTGNAEFAVGAASSYPSYYWMGYSSSIATLSKPGPSAQTVFSVSGRINATETVTTLQVQLSGASNGYYLYDRTLTTINWASYVDGGFYRIYNSAYGDRLALSSNDLYIYTLQVNAGGNALKYQAGGQITAAASKRSLKNDINYNISGLSIINKLKPASFTWKKTEMESEEVGKIKALHKNYGFIAEDIAEVDSAIAVLEPVINKNMTKEQKEDAFKDIDSWVPSYYSETGILALAIKAIQELNLEIIDLKSKLGYTS